MMKSVKDSVLSYRSICRGSEAVPEKESQPGPRCVVLWHGLAASTRLTYRTTEVLYRLHHTIPQFRNSDGSILPASQGALPEWVSWLGGVRRIQPKPSNRTSPPAVSTRGRRPPFSACESPLLQRVIRGIKRYMGERDRNPSCNHMRNTQTIVGGLQPCQPARAAQFEASVTQHSQASSDAANSRCEAQKNLTQASTSRGLRSILSLIGVPSMSSHRPSSKTDP